MPCITYMVVHLAQVDSNSHPDNRSKQAYRLDDVMRFNALEEAQRDGSERKDDGECSKHDGCVRWSDLVSIAHCLSIGASIRRTQE